jgi:hypothetical protein
MGAGNLSRATMGFLWNRIRRLQKNKSAANERKVEILEVFPTPYYEDISLSEWLAHTPSRLVNGHIGNGEEFCGRSTRRKL